MTANVSQFYAALDATMAHNEMKGLLQEIEEADQDYDRRYLLVLKAVLAAAENGWQAGFRIDPSEPEWPVAYIELPTGQVSWHLPQHPVAWDGHDTAEKYRRCRGYANPLP